LRLDSRPGWGGYMEVSLENSQSYSVSCVLPVPCINLDPSNPHTIYTALIFAADECKKHGQKHCVITFDQPLYIKAADMVAACGNGGELSSVIV